jgi:hypothetical protein
MKQEASVTAGAHVQQIKRDRRALSAPTVAAMREQLPRFVKPPFLAGRRHPWSTRAEVGGGRWCVA